MHWFLPTWWRYLLSKKSPDYSWIAVIWCRARGHPAGVRWYSGGFSPDMHCLDCGDDLG